MSSITISGYNQIDFSALLQAVMEQESAPVQTMQTQRSSLQTQKNSFATLATKLAALETEVQALASDDAFGGRSVQVSDSGAVSVAAGATAGTGSYEVVVNELARSQVTATDSTHTDRDTTAVATGGSLVINGVTVTVGSPVTLQALAEAINRTPDVGVVATLVNAGGRYQLVLTATRSGRANAFSIENNLSGGAGVSFSGTNAVEASDADVLVNNIRITSPTNTIEDAIPGATLTVSKKNPGVPVSVTISRDDSATKSNVQDFVSAYNDLVHFFAAQATSAGQGQASSIGRDAVVRQLRISLREVISRSFGGGGTYSNLSQVGIEFTRTGELKLNEELFDAAARDHLSDLQGLFQGSGGAFSAVGSAIGTFTDSDGLVPGASERLDTQMRNMDTRIAALEARLAVRQRALQQEYAAADAAMTQLNSQASALDSLGSQYSLF
jgi:flagellar hook-associated protein 2